MRWLDLVEITTKERTYTGFIDEVHSDHIVLDSWGVEDLPTREEGKQYEIKYRRIIKIINLGAQ